MNILGIPLQELLLRIPALLLALTVHEVAHGYVAMKLGDPTARNLGRLTLNPLKHFDPFGALCMLLFRFGWAKPVPINTRYFRKPRRDMALTALAGPASNFLMAFAGMFIYYLSFLLFVKLPAATGTLANFEEVWLTFLSIFVIMNVSFGVFNMIPVPPLDGSRILLTFLPPRYYFGLMKYERYISVGLFLMLYLGVLDRPLSWLVSTIVMGMRDIILLLPIF